MAKAIAAKVPGTNNLMVRNLKDGDDIKQAILAMEADYPGWDIEVIGHQSFGSEPAGGPESGMAPGY